MNRLLSTAAIIQQLPGILLTKLLSSAIVMMNILLNTYIEYSSDYSRGGVS